MDYSIIIYIILGIAPSLIWLFYYLRKDANPEPKGMVLKIFLWGALITLPVFFIQIGFLTLLDQININALIRDIIYWFLIISLSEEFFKYLVTRVKVVNSPHLDEPLDIMLYAVIAALGFAAVENVLYLFVPTGQMSFNQLMNRALMISLIRFIGAIFLHTLCSAIIGYSMAISFYKTKIKHISVATGMFLAVLLHGLYNFSIMTLSGYLKLIIPASIIMILAIFVFHGFEKLKKMKSVCKIN